MQNGATEDRFRPMPTAVTATILVVSAALLGLVARRWRTTSVPWGAVPLFAAAVSPLPPWVSAAVAAAVILTELPGRPRRLPEVGGAVVLALLAGRYSGSTPAPLALLLPLHLLAPLPGAISRRLATTSGHREPPPAMEEAAAAVVLLAASALVTLGLTAPLPLALGLAVPATLPLLLAGGGERIARRLACHAMAEAAAAVVAASRTGPTASLDAAAEDLHRLLLPFLEARLTVLGINPPFAAGGPSFGIHPPAGEHRAEVRALLQRLCRRGAGLPGARRTRPGDPEHLLPEWPHGLVVPVHTRGQLVAVAASLGTRRLPDDLLAPLGEVVAGLVEHLVEDRRNAARRAYLERRVSAHAQRLQRLLITSQAIQTAPDLRTVASNLVRATRVSFDLAWAGLLLEHQGDGAFLLTARSGSEGTAPARGRGERIPRAQLERVLAEGRRISRAIVIPAARWPFPVGAGRTEHLIVLPVGREATTIAYLVMAPGPAQPVLELEELQSLEILTDHAAPALSAALRFEELRREAMLDALTGIPNRRALDRSLARLLRDAAPGGGVVAVAMLDLDDFKLVNDRHGHRIGDRVLQELARLLTRGLRAQDTVARYGGEEFCVLMPGLSARRAALVLDRIRATVAEHPFASGELTRPLTLTVSVGVAGAPGDGTGARELLERADAALYQAKRLGKNRVVTTADLVYDAVSPEDEPFG